MARFPAVVIMNVVIVVAVFVNFVAAVFVNVLSSKLTWQSFRFDSLRYNFWWDLW